MKTYYKNLSQFIQALDKAGELKTVDEEVSAYLEISKLTDRESKSPAGGKALFFKKVRHSQFPVATNLFGSNRRICMAMGVEDLNQLGDRIKDMIQIDPPENLKDTLNLLPTALSIRNYFPRRSKMKIPPCQQVVHKGEAVDLTGLPVLHCWPKDAGPFVTLPLVFTKSLNTGKRNLGMYRLQVFDRHTTGMHWHIHKDGSHYFNEYRQAGKRMPVAVAIGADPATIYAATAPLPRNLDEIILAGFIRNRPVRMARCLTIDMEVPAEAEFVLEGYVDPNELRTEGPFGDHTGYYSLADEYPVFHVTALTHRKAPVYCATLVGPPPMEDCYLAKTTERLFLPLLQSVMPEIVDYWLPWEGVFHNIVIVSIRKEYPGHAQKIIHGLWGQGQMGMCKAIVVVDHDIDPKNPLMVLKQFCSHFDADSDLILSKGMLDVLDHASPIPQFGNKIGVDLTRRFPGEPARRSDYGHQGLHDWEVDSLDGMDGISATRIFELKKDTGHESMSDCAILFLCVQKSENRSGRYYAEKILAEKKLSGFRFILMFDLNIDLFNHSLLLWKLFNNVDPGRDLFIEGPRCVVDACKKIAADGHLREWPDELTFDPT
jgi:4-hydroxy-3-polyprenylbenzoate decarboxylase